VQDDYAFRTRNSKEACRLKEGPLYYNKNRLEGIGLNNGLNWLVASCRRQNATSIELKGDHITDSVLAQLYSQKQLRELHIVDAKCVTNAGLTYIENLLQLEWLNMDGVAITDRGLFFIQRMTKLRGLQLTNAFVTSWGLEYLLALKRLDYLELDGTNVDDEGLRVLAKLTNLKTLRLSRTAVTDKGIRKLQAMKKLRTLVLKESHVTESCLQKLKKQMPECEISWSPYTLPLAKPAKLPTLFHRDLPFPAAENETTRGWYLKLASDSHKVKINQLSLSPRPEYMVKRSNFKPSQPSWFKLIDWY
jgi:predicted transcriptional regulator